MFYNICQFNNKPDFKEYLRKVLFNQKDLLINVFMSKPFTQSKNIKVIKIHLKG